jgi:DNA-directed RNA polymerase subunit RPC12/RpoP
MGKSNSRKKRTEAHLQKKANFLKNELQLPVSEYPNAWAKYNRRWVAAWLILPIVILYAMVAVIFEFHHGPTSEGSVIVSVAAIMAVQLVLYFRFTQWPCPRCGKPFHRWFEESQRRIIYATLFSRSERCQYCGLRRNTVPEEPKTSKL